MFGAVSFHYQGREHWKLLHSVLAPPSSPVDVGKSYIEECRAAAWANVS